MSIFSPSKNTDYDWDSNTVKNVYLLNLRTKMILSFNESRLGSSWREIVSIPRGKVLGGTSAIDLMVYTRGQKEDVDDWERMEAIG